MTEKQITDWMAVFMELDNLHEDSKKENKRTTIIEKYAKIALGEIYKAGKEIRAKLGTAEDIKPDAASLIEFVHPIISTCYAWTLLFEMTNEKRKGDLQSVIEIQNRLSALSFGNNKVFLTSAARMNTLAFLFGYILGKEDRL